jgi:hypothetical protein
MPIKEMLFFQSPPTVRKAMGFLVAGWISLLAFVYHINLVSPGKIHLNLNVRVALVGVVICFFVFKIKPWARTFCIFINIAVIGINGIFLVPFLLAPKITSPALALHALLTGTLFGICTYFLLVAPTAVFYRAQLPANKQKNSSEGRENSSR